jgi:hypothetical protein
VELLVGDYKMTWQKTQGGLLWARVEGTNDYVEVLADEDGKLLMSGTVTTSSSESESDTDTVTSTNSYVAVLDWDCNDFAKKTVMIENLSGSNDIYFKVNLCATDGGIEDEFVEETTLAYGETAKVTLSGRYDTLLVYIKSKVNGSHASVQIDWNGGV